MSRKYKKSFDNKIVLDNKNFQKILNFYLFECPVDNSSYRGLKFRDYGWRKSPAFSKLKNKMLKAWVAGNLKKNYYPCKKDELKKKFELVNDILPCEEYCVFLKYDESTVMQSLYSAIRNAFAHGSFRVSKYNKKRMYYFQNYKGYKKAEIILSEETLVAWIKIIKEGYNIS